MNIQSASKIISFIHYSNCMLLVEMCLVYSSNFKYRQVYNEETLYISSDDSFGDTPFGRPRLYL